MTKKTRIKIWIVVVTMCVVCFSDRSFAEDNETFWTIWWLLNLLVGVLSWGWVLLANLAWQFLTNKWIYGEILWLDTLLWQYWNIMKNMANFWLWLYFVYKIFSWLIHKDDIQKNLWKTLLWLLIAWVGIQASWFFTAAIVDVSTITLSAVWAFPAQIIGWSDENVQKSVEQSMKDYFGYDGQSEWEILDLFPKNMQTNEILQKITYNLESSYESNNGWEHLTKKKFFDSLIPNQNDVSWPLYYMWFGILKPDKVVNLETFTGDTIKNSIINLVIHWWTIIVYTIEMWVLCVLALMRILYLWMFIVLSPIAILLWCIWAADDNIKKASFLESIMKEINIKTFFINVFKPTIIVLWMWLAMIFASLMNGAITKDTNIDLGWVKVQTTEINSGSNQNWNSNTTYTTTMEMKSLKFTVSNMCKWLLEFIVSIITVVLVYIIISIAAKMWGWKDFVSSRINKIQDNIEWAMTSLPVMPVAGYDENGEPDTHYLNAKQVFSGEWLLWQKIAHYERKLNEEYSKDQDKILGKLWLLDDDSLTETMTTGITNAWSHLKGLPSLTEKKKYIDENVKTDNWRWLKLNPKATDTDHSWVKEFEKWLEESKGEQFSWVTNGSTWKEMVEWWNANKDTRTLGDMFNNVSWSAQAYAEFFGLKLSVYDWEHLKDADISKK